MDTLRLLIMSSSIGYRIRTLRTEAKMKQRELAKLCDVSRSAVSQWESDGIAQIASDHLYRCAKALHTSVEYLLYGKDPAVRETPAPYTAAPDASHELAEIWPRLTKRQRETLTAEAARLADENAALLAEFSDSQR